MIYVISYIWIMFLYLSCGKTLLAQEMRRFDAGRWQIANARRHGKVESETQKRA